MRILEEHYKRQVEDLKKLSKGFGISPTLAMKHKYMARCTRIYWMGMYAVKYNDGTDVKLYTLAEKRKKFYLNKLMNYENNNSNKKTSI